MLAIIMGLTFTNVSTSSGRDSSRCSIHSLPPSIISLQIDELAVIRLRKLKENSDYLQFMWKCDVVESWIGEFTLPSTPLTLCLIQVIRSLKSVEGTSVETSPPSRFFSPNRQPSMLDSTLSSTMESEGSRNCEEKRERREEKKRVIAGRMNS